MPKVNAKQQREAMWQEALAAAEVVAENAARMWVQQRTGGAMSFEEGLKTMLDACGFSHIEFKNRGTAFARWYRKTYGVDFIYFRNAAWTGTQNMGILEAGYRAATAALKEQGIEEVRFWSRID